MDMQALQRQQILQALNSENNPIIQNSVQQQNHIFDQNLAAVGVL